MLENHTSQEVQTSYKITNMTNFGILPENVVLKPNSITPIEIIYMPSNLDVK